MAASASVNLGSSNNGEHGPEAGTDATYASGQAPRPRHVDVRAQGKVANGKRKTENGERRAANGNDPLLICHMSDSSDRCHQADHFSPVCVPDGFTNPLAAHTTREKIAENSSQMINSSGALSHLPLVLTSAGLPSSTRNPKK